LSAAFFGNLDLGRVSTSSEPNLKSDGVNDGMR